MGRVHSIETGSAVDGPGLRTVVFLQGCPLRCKFCHNPDTWDFSGGQERSAEEIAQTALRLKRFYSVSILGKVVCVIHGAYVGKLRDRDCVLNGDCVLKKRRRRIICRLLKITVG